MNQTGLLRTLATQFNGVVVYAEHRYYGESLPFGNYSLDGSNVTYLSIENAMADYVAIIQHVRETFSLKGPVISFGCSYGAMLNAYFKFSYPQHIHGALSSAGPIFWNMSMSSWNDVVQESYSSIPECYDQAKKEFTVFNSLFAGFEQASKISTELKLCSVPSTTLDALNLLNYLKYAYTSSTEFNYPQALFYDVSWPLNATCEGDSSSTFPISRKALDLWFNRSGTLECFDFKNLDLHGTSTIGPAWSYQTCSQILLTSGVYGACDLFGCPFPKPSEQSFMDDRVKILLAKIQCGS